MTYEIKLPVRQQELVRLIALGDSAAVRDTINQLGALGLRRPQQVGRSSCPLGEKGNISQFTPGDMYPVTK